MTSKARKSERTTVKTFEALRRTQGEGTLSEGWFHKHAYWAGLIMWAYTGLSFMLSLYPRGSLWTAVFGIYGLLMVSKWFYMLGQRNAGRRERE
jgi:hypothetical protein